MVSAKLKCPRCSRILTVNMPTNEVECICHLYCDDGDEPSDCNLTPYEYTGDLKWPMGLNNSSELNDKKVLGRTFYCSIHTKYSTKQPIILEVNWEQWLSQRRLPSEMREVETNY